MVPAEVNAREGLPPGPPVPSGREVRDLREIALRGVHACSKGRAFLRDVLGREFEKSGFPPRLRAAASDLASGVIRRRLTLDHLISPCSDLALRKVHPLLLDILRLAAYEILFVERIPAHASVSEAVNLAKRLVRPEFAGFANAVLRHLIRDIEATAGIDGPFRPSARELRIGPRRVVRFRRDVFPDPGTDAIGWLVSAGGQPGWLVERWMRTTEAARVVGTWRASANRWRQM